MTSPVDDPAVATFEEAAGTLEGAAADSTTAARHARRLGRERMRGREWREVLGGGTARNILELVAAATRKLSAAAGQLRRAIVNALHADGLRVKQIADALDVSHQRISRVLRRGHGDASHPE